MGKALGGKGRGKREQFLSDAKTRGGERDTPVFSVATRERKQG